MEYKNNECCISPDIKKLIYIMYCTLFGIKNTPLCAQYKCLEGVQNSECYVLPSFHNNENITHRWAGTCKSHDVYFAGTVLALIRKISFLFLVMESGALYRIGKTFGLQTGTGGLWGLFAVLGSMIPYHALGCICCGFFSHELQQDYQQKILTTTPG
jgi:hypothetical protein